MAVIESRFANAEVNPPIAEIESAEIEPADKVFAVVESKFAKIEVNPAIAEIEAAVRALAVKALAVIEPAVMKLAVSETAEIESAVKLVAEREPLTVKLAEGLFVLMPTFPPVKTIKGSVADVARPGEKTCIEYFSTGASVSPVTVRLPARAKVSPELVTIAA